MLHLKYVLETSVKEDEEGNTKSVAYLPIKIGEFVTDSQNNTMQFNKSHLLVSCYPRCPSQIKQRVIK